MEYFEVIRKRYSVRSYRREKVEEEKLARIREAALLAPTACNRQAFKLLVIDTEGRENELRKIYNSGWFANAPVILGVCSIPGKAWVRSDGKNYGDVDAAIVMDHIILAATDLGLGTCWIGAFNKAAAKQVLGLDEAWEPVAFTPLGYAADTPAKKVRRPPSEIVVVK